MGDQLILTKPIGTGIINTAIKGGLATPETIDMVTQLITTLNQDAAAVMTHYPVSACTDITGFGLLGHLAEMITDADIGIRLDSGTVPLIPGTPDFARQGFIPGGAFNNKSFRSQQIKAVQMAVEEINSAGGVQVCPIWIVLSNRVSC